ncbi:MAG: YjgP/YjgQ family permease [Halobacteriovoraceae bacterium]|jgi:lipopolysaccharide export system permease protein|nr:YjgP/YjgQ family permease [Halobacteriovoraceae bacterium]MBT5092724.1 YjgP/YjgQ family permease [Halobacteriovoraceae bacterium]
MLKTSQRYLAASFIPPFLLSTVFFVLFLLTFQLFRITRIVINKGVELSTLFELIGHIAITFLPMAIPLSALFATIFTLSKMSEDSEIVAMRSFGTTKWQLFTPFLIIGVMIGAVVFSLNQNLIPYSKNQFKNSIIRLTSRGMLTDIKAENFFTDIPGVTLFAEKVENEGQILKDVFIQIRQKGKEEQRVIFAKQGILIKQKVGKMATPSIRLHLSDGNIITTSQTEDREIEKILFEEYDFPILSGGETPGFVTKDSMRSNQELREVIRARDKELTTLLSKDNRSSREEQRVHEIRKRLPKSKIEYWSRINTPLICLLFIFLGFSLGIKKGRGRQRNTGAISFLVLVLYYALFFAGISYSRKGHITPAMAVFLPGFIISVVGYRFYKKLDWMS